MKDETYFEIVSEEEKSEIEELKRKLEETEKQLNELNRSLEQKVIERTVEIRKLLNHKIRFIDNLSHDLATPLTPLITLLPLLKEKVEDQKAREIIDTCIRNVEYIKRVIDNTRELVNATTTDLILRKENLSDIVNEIIKKYEPIFKNNKIEVKNKISNDVEVKTEKNRLLQVIDQIVSNAINSMPNGGVITFNSKLVKRENGEFIQVSITDTGVGLRKEELGKIFDEFYKTDSARQKLDSTGLGLSICKAIIEKHGGKIWADSRGPGEGVSIIFTLPTKEYIYDRSF